MVGSAERILETHHVVRAVVRAIDWLVQRGVVSRHRATHRIGQTRVETALKDTWAAPNKRAAEAHIARLVDALRTRAELPKLADWIEETAHETRGFYALDHAAHHRRMKDNECD